ncbi:MAG TPA: XRE family transcriptional regulator [Candidatus Saccharimonadales bacterium]|nr:XRE family transcriptional regulator [Candidatus Saccharimonadales bacterium]
MSIGTMGFVAERLVQGREARGLTLTALADLIQVNKSAISHYEKGLHTPSPEILKNISQKLNLPICFFLKPNPIINSSSRIFYRSMCAVTKQARKRAERRFEWLKEIIIYLSEFLDFPKPNLPKFDAPKDFRKITANMIENYTQQLRDFWNLGFGPIADVIRCLEANGIFVSYGNLDAEMLDAFSELENETPFVFLNADKNILARSRFDSAHELGHLVLHQHVDKTTLQKTTDFKLLELQAHHFASAFLFPAKSFVDELWGVSLDSFRSLKSRWKVSIAAMISRSIQLELIDENEAKRLWINRNRRGWRTFEPLDDLPVEVPKMLSQSFNVILENKVKTKDQILNDLAISSNDIEELTNLPKGYLLDKQDETIPTLKLPENVIKFSQDRIKNI